MLTLYDATLGHHTTITYFLFSTTDSSHKVENILSMPALESSDSSGDFGLTRDSSFHYA